MRVEPKKCSGWPSTWVHDRTRSRSEPISQDGLAGFVKSALSRSWAGRSSRLALIVTDENVAPKAPSIADALQAAGLRSETLVLPPGEGTKSLEAASRPTSGWSRSALIGTR